MPKAAARTFAIRLDHDGTQAGNFNAAGDPILSYIKPWITGDDGQPKRQPDHWMLTYPTPNGPRSFDTGVLNHNDPVTAEVEAQQHLRGIGFTQPAVIGTPAPEDTGW